MGLWVGFPVLRFSSPSWKSTAPSLYKDAFIDIKNGLV